MVLSSATNHVIVTTVTSAVCHNYYIFYFSLNLPLVAAKTRQARVGLAPRGFHTKIGRLELFVKFRISLAGAPSSDTSFELAALIPNFASRLFIMF